MLWYNHLCLLIWTLFSGERCGPWASCCRKWSPLYKMVLRHRPSMPPKIRKKPVQPKEECLVQNVAERLTRVFYRRQARWLDILRGSETTTEHGNRVLDLHGNNIEMGKWARFLQFFHPAFEYHRKLHTPTRYAASSHSEIPPQSINTGTTIDFYGTGQWIINRWALVLTQWIMQLGVSM